MGPGYAGPGRRGPRTRACFEWLPQRGGGSILPSASRPGEPDPQLAVGGFAERHRIALAKEGGQGCRAILEFGHGAPPAHQTERNGCRSRDPHVALLDLDRPRLPPSNPSIRPQRRGRAHVPPADHSPVKQQADAGNREARGIGHPEAACAAAKKRAGRGARPIIGRRLSRRAGHRSRFAAPRPHGGISSTEPR